MLSENTRKIYVRRVKEFFKDKSKIENRSKQSLAQTKRGLIIFYNKQGIYYNNDISLIIKTYNEAKRARKKKRDDLYFYPVLKKINFIKDKRKKLAFRLQMISGLRISEICNLKPEHIKFMEDFRMIVTVINGKGGKNRRLQTLKDKYVWKELQKLELRKGKYFHNATTLQVLASSLGFKTHDLRKVFAHVIYYKSGDIELLRALLGHDGNDTYKTYVKGINLTNTKYDI